MSKFTYGQDTPAGVYIESDDPPSSSEQPGCPHPRACEYDGCRLKCWPHVTSAPSEKPQPADRLRTFVRAKSPGQCKMLSKGSACDCLLCCIDALQSATERSVSRCRCGYGPGWAGIPECQQPWAGDPAYRPKYEHCILRTADKTASDKGQG